VSGIEIEYDQKTIGEAIARAAMSIWSRGVYDDGGESPGVTQLFDDNSWSAWLRDPDLGGCPEGYTRPPDPDYCGHGAACALRLVGDYLEDRQGMPVSVSPVICNQVMPSTWRLSSADKWSDAGYERPAVYDARHDDGSPSNTRAGDIVVVETIGGAPYGDHITVARGPARSGGVPTVEANASGERPDGSRGKGVVKRTRSTHDIRQIIRFTDDHLVEVER